MGHITLAIMAEICAKLGRSLEWRDCTRLHCMRFRINRVTVITGFAAKR